MAYLQSEEGLELPNVPELDGRVVAAREELVAVGQDRQRHNRVVMGLEVVDHLIVVEHPNVLVLVGGDQQIRERQNPGLPNAVPVGGHLALCRELQRTAHFGGFLVEHNQAVGIHKSRHQDFRIVVDEADRSGDVLLREPLGSLVPVRVELLQFGRDLAVSRGLRFFLEAIHADCRIRRSRK